jgi:hypothetical protein
MHLTSAVRHRRLLLFSFVFRHPWRLGPRSRLRRLFGPAMRNRAPTCAWTDLQWWQADPHG